MKNIETRLDQIEAKITNEDFLKNKGLGNEVGYYIFDYAPQDELKVRQHIAYLKAKINKSASGVKIVEYDLYQLVISVLKERGYLEKCFQFEQTKGLDYTYQAIIKMLRLTSKTNLLVNYIVEHTQAHSVVFITGVGKCYPIVRSHNVLNNLHQVLDSVPVVMFFPGVYSGQDLQLFGTIKDDNYYRAFKLI
ncbi:DUF1788 domain-containing protein [Acetobacterium wieringae]|uniref:DUF1788 domain-containing protein n=1 Tax=Acetobacterium wieringae TaxID=52694 RepID=UPI002033DFA2|nr:DUF1788 domain-containing protein [Acetobacterium wieringae]URN84938.1 DUF1788 domain-containing protein [Acetobacterium wieringae]